ncbi:probable methyltransferase TARBP1 isoform X2 [Maniola jurtina]|uniref:probable methyltransferase TARBP1 isoform X2 n=1 Tax=Maniola jurtina TaxID=191418 RepID=UPI001E68E351|nr:probable methyltransferase TARBP1 isoform X2 [Maniola jurtina]
MESFINHEVQNQLKSNNIPLSSQFTIMYWIVIHKLKDGICLQEEYEFLMDLLLSHIMGPVFSIRLQAQYLSSRIFEANEISVNKLDNSQYAYMIKVINGTLQEIAKADDKSFKRLKNDYFIGEFDIIEDLIPCEIYWGLPQLVAALSNNIIEDDFLRNILNEIESNLNLDENDKFHNEWKEKRRKTSDALQFKARNKTINKEVESLEETGTIQKKYVPWKNMSDVDVYDNETKSNKTELIVVASLIAKLPNLGGMARTSEVFGVRAYVVDSLRHLQDKQFQGLSVSAERWVPVEEVRPAQLKDYLTMKKSAGYSVVAAEQTSTSIKLQNFKFPNKTLLLLGNEKEGVPCDLLPLMDHCVEIPQQGVIRSLNVHVTAAIFIWEYARQNML